MCCYTQGAAGPHLARMPPRTAISHSSSATTVHIATCVIPLALPACVSRFASSLAQGPGSHRQLTPSQERTHARTHARCQTSHTDALTSFSVWVLPKRSSPISVQRRRGGSTASTDGASPRCLGPRWLDRIHLSRFVTMRTCRHPLASRPGCPTPAVLFGPSPPHPIRTGK